MAVKVVCRKVKLLSQRWRRPMCVCSTSYSSWRWSLHTSSL